MDRTFIETYQSRVDRSGMNLVILVEAVEQQSNAGSLPSGGPSTAVEEAPWTVTSAERTGLAFWLDDVRRAASEDPENSSKDQEGRKKCQNRPISPPSLDEKMWRSC